MELKEKLLNKREFIEKFGEGPCLGFTVDISKLDNWHKRYVLTCLLNEISWGGRNNRSTVQGPFRHDETILFKFVEVSFVYLTDGEPWKYTDEPSVLSPLFTPRWRSTKWKND